jgi:hypothetical protein
MTHRFARTTWFFIAAALLLVGCTKVEVTEPADGGEYFGQPGEVLTITFRAKVTNYGTSDTKVLFALDGDGYWDNVFYDEVCPPGITWMETTHPVEVTDQAETHLFDASCPMHLDSISFEVIPVSQ